MLAVGSCSDPTSPPNTLFGLRVWAEVTPETVHIGNLRSGFLVRVVERNPTNQPIIVPKLPDVRTIAEQYEIGCTTSHYVCGPSFTWFTPQDDTFPPLQTSYAEDSVYMVSWAFSALKPKPGRYRVRAWFHGQEGTSATLVVVP